MNRVTYFEIQADEPERAVKFYRDVFGWQIEKMNFLGADYWMIATAPKGSKEEGINGGLLKRPFKTPPKEHGTNAFTCTVQVEDFDGIAEKIMAGGGIVAMAKFAMPGMAWQGYFLDTEGNVFGVHQPDPNAK